MALSKFDLCNTALSELRVSKISSFADGTRASEIAGTVYEQRVNEVFGEYRWNFAKGQEKMAREATPPKARWTYFFTIPTSCLLLHTVTLLDVPIVYDVYGNSIGCDLGPDDIPTTDFTRKIDEGNWPTYFQAVVTAKLKISFAGGITGKAELVTDARNEYEAALMRARRSDSQMKTTRKFAPSRLVGYR